MDLKLSNMSKKTLKYKIRTPYNYEIVEGEINSGEIVTIPDESYTIEEILDKFTKGIHLGIEQDGQYSDSDDFDDVDERTYLNDLSDIDDVQASMVERRKRKQSKSQKADDKGGLPPGDLQKSPKGESSADQ